MAEVALVRLSKLYAGRPVVDAVDISVRDGELLCVIGPSGCGKSTTLRLVAGFITPSAGEILVGGRKLSWPDGCLPPERRNMSMIFQSYALWPHMTIAENVGYGLTLRRLPRAEIAARTRTMLDVVKLGSLADRYPSELSGGQQQRAALARALVIEPETLLLDEPLSNLDASLREEMRFELRRLHDEYRYTTIYVTHDQSEAMTAADRIVVMNEGRVEQIGRPQEIYEKPRTEFVARFFGGANILSGTAVDPSALSVDGVTINAAEKLFEAGRPGALSIRFHDVRVHAARPSGASGMQGLPMRVARRTFLGPTVDLALEHAGGTAFRASTSPDLAIPADGEVFVELPAEKCRPLQVRAEG
ncbi:MULTISPECIES: ABC transporter ATP-binding protein [Rhodomicrobium]|uniref:ABC transporter ATP-binding protein n=1 Tax=Rhodomicrobium TaxID=1068 RepID=UPI000B4A83ED|nr:MULTISPECIES: ABC transporter ATP-binding protein [Rhodomicrobium]